MFETPIWDIQIWKEDDFAEEKENTCVSLPNDRTEYIRGKTHELSLSLFSTSPWECDYSSSAAETGSNGEVHVAFLNLNPVKTAKIKKTFPKLFRTSRILEEVCVRATTRERQKIQYRFK